MSKSRFSYLSLLLLPIVASAESESCWVPPAKFVPEQALQEGEIQFQADKTELLQDQVATFSGSVDISSLEAQIQADKATIDKTQRKLVAKGNVNFQNPEMQVNSDSVLLDTDSGQFDMQNSDYKLSTFNGRGEAERILLDRAAGIVLEDVKFTTCPEGGEDWSMQASKIELAPGELWGKARNTRFYVGGVPVFYLPYFIFPVSDVRQSGLLIPNPGSSSTTGLSYEQPYYWNIAPNYDATISPRIMTDRGVQLKTTFRYLTENHNGQVNIEYLPSDSALSPSVDRYFYRYTHNGTLSENWQLAVEYNDLSDDNYIVDLGSDYYSRADTHLYQTLALNYYTESTNFSAKFRDFEVIGNHPSTYRAIPELNLNYKGPQFAGFEFRLNSELAYFDNNMNDSPAALRFHLAPTLALPYQYAWGEFKAEASVLNTYYRQENIENTALSEEVNRTLGQGRLFGALYFERDSILAGEDSVLTLEPKAQYLYTTFEDQQNIGLYDTTLLFNDFSGLFRGQEFTGLDRISDNNQVTLGVTSRLLDKNSREQFALSLGQIFYLESNQVLAATKGSNRSALATELDWRLGSKWFAHSEMQITTSTNKVERSSFSLEYQLDENRLVQINHRFVRELSGERIDQIGVVASWPLAKNWQWIGRWYKDMNRNRTIESYSGIQYESCCWSLAIVAQKHLTNRIDYNGNQSTDEFDSSINLIFNFKGLSSRSASRKILEDGLFGYQQPYSVY